MNRTTVARLAAISAVALAAPAGARAQQGAVISGRVTNQRTGQGVAGATVAIPELGVGATTNETGAYSLTIPAARARGQQVLLQVRFIGYKPQRQTIALSATRQTFNFVLETDVSRLSEVVVTGVSVATERSKVPFAVQRIDASQTPVPGVTPLAQIAGKVPGASIVGTSGRPGASPEVILRGPKSFNASGRSQEPLYIVDGVILAPNAGTGSGPLADINPQDIQSVEVVAGTAAASLYGSQAANGVIQITTKRGASTANGVRFSARGEYGVNDIENEIGIAQRHALLMDPTQTRFCISSGLSTAQGRGCYRTVDWLTESLRINDVAQDYPYSTVSFPLDPGSGLQAVDARRLFQTTPWPGANYNAVQQLARPKPLAIGNIDMTGRFGSTNVFAAVNSTKQGGALAYLNGYERNSFRLNAGQAVGTKLQIDGSTYFARTSADGFNQDGNGPAFFRLTRTPPIVDLTRTDGQGRLLIRTNIQGAGTQNENALYSLQNVSRWDFTNRFIGALSARYTPTSWVNADGSIGFDNQDLSGRQFTNRGFRTVTAAPATNNGSIFNYAQGNRSLNTSAGLTFPNVTPFVKDLQVTPSLRTLYLQQDYEQRNVGGNQLYVSNVETYTNALQTTLSGTATRQSVRQLTYSGGLRAEYKERYIVDGAVRRDGNSTFGADNRWQTYGRIAGTWLASSEPFFAALNDKIDLLKFSANYGTSGLSPAFSSQYESYTIGTGGLLTPAVLGNPNLRPQVDQGYEFNAEIGAFRNFNLQATYARSDTKDQIDIVNLPVAQRFQQQWQNIGTLRNSTVELSLGFPVLKTRLINWTGRANYARTITTVTKLDIPAYTRGGTGQAQNDIFYIREGERFSTFYGQKFATSCSELPANAAASCGTATSQFQKNSDGLIVWTGGHPVTAGYTENLWNTSLPANSPYAPYHSASVGYYAWGHPIVLRDTLGANTALNLPLGQALPKFRWSLSQNINVKRLTAYALLDAAVGQSVWNQARAWSYLDFLSADQDQTGKDLGDVKPLSYYYRTQYNNIGAGGLYNVLAPNNFFVEKASYAKLREVTVSYNIGKIARSGDFTIGVTGRNLHTWSKYKGFDPEVGSSQTSGAFGSGALTAVDFFGFPNLRTVSFTVSARY